MLLSVKMYSDRFVDSTEKLTRKGWCSPSVWVWRMNAKGVKLTLHLAFSDFLPSGAFFGQTFPNPILELKFLFFFVGKDGLGGFWRILSIWKRFRVHFGAILMDFSTQNALKSCLIYFFKIGFGNVCFRHQNLRTYQPIPLLDSKLLRLSKQVGRSVF